MTKQTFTTAAPLPVPTACGNCGIEERHFIHHIFHRGIYRKLCSNCVLRLNPQSFCPTCLAVYNPSPPPPNAPLVTCLKCYSRSHNTCVAVNPNYTCPLCLNPKYPNFSLRKGKNVGLGDDEHGSRVIDKKAARILLTAARIAATSMSKAAVNARIEAERRAMEAAYSRKRAREALEHVAYLVANDYNNKIKKKQVVLPNNVNNNGGSSSNNHGLSMVEVAVPLDQAENKVGNGVDGSSEVLVAFNAVHLKGQMNPNNGSAMAVEANGGLVRSASGAEDDNSGVLECGNRTVSNGAVSVQDHDQDQHM